MTSTVRAATATDLPRVLALYAELNPDDAPLGPDAAASTWARVLQQPARVVFVAEVDGVVQGTIDCTVIENLTRGQRPFMVIENVVVSRAHRRRGIGADLLTAATRLARESGCYKAQLITDDFPETLAFYASGGYTRRKRGLKRYFAFAPDEADRRRQRYGGVPEGDVGL